MYINVLCAYSDSSESWETDGSQPSETPEDDERTSSQKPEETTGSSPLSTRWPTFRGGAGATAEIHVGPTGRIEDRKVVLVGRGRPPMMGENRTLQEYPILEQRVSGCPETYQKQPYEYVSIAPLETFYQCLWCPERPHVEPLTREGLVLHQHWTHGYKWSCLYDNCDATIESYSLIAEHFWRRHRWNHHRDIIPLC